MAGVEIKRFEMEVVRMHCNCKPVLRRLLDRPGVRSFYNLEGGSPSLTHPQVYSLMRIEQAFVEFPNL